MQINIHDLMNNIEDSSVQLEETNVVSSDRIKELTRMKLNMTSNANRRFKSKKILVIAAAVSLVAALSIGAYAAISGGLKDISISEGTWAEPIQNGSDVQETSAKYEFISLQGFSESAENQALREWMKFTESYDTDGTILNEVGNKPTPWYEKYGEYTVYSQEMADKLDEITAKYGLTLHTSKNIPCNSKQELDARFGEIMTDANYAGYCYEDGTFHADGEFGKYDFQIGRAMKGVFDEVYLNIGSRDNYEEWTYETSSGKTVLLALSKNKALILADLDKSFVSVNVLLNLNRDDVKAMSREDLENMANHINFSIL